MKIEEFITLFLNDWYDGDEETLMNDLEKLLASERRRIADRIRKIREREGLDPIEDRMIERCARIAGRKAKG